MLREGRSELVRTGSTPGLHLTADAARRPTAPAASRGSGRNQIGCVSRNYLVVARVDGTEQVWPPSIGSARGKTS